MKGTIKFYNDSKGYGFILGEDGKDTFVHATGLNGLVPKEGQEVTFETMIDKVKGKPCAVNVRVA